MKLTKMFVALVAASALVVLAATPASAVIHDLRVDSGTLFNTVIGTLDFSGGGTPTPPCTNLATDTDTITIDETGTGTPTTTTVTAVSITSSLISGTPTFPYMVNITKNSTGNFGGTISSLGPFTTNLTLRITFTRAVSTTTGVCTSDTGGTTPALTCTVRLDFTTTVTGATPLLGTATTHPLTSGATVHLAGIGIFGSALATCSAPFATLLTTINNNNVAVVGSLTLAVVT